MSYRTYCGTAAVSLSLILPAHAQDVIDEIVIADYRERTAAELPTSLTILDAEAIEQGGIQHFEELISAIPNLNWSGDGNRARYLQIRGVGEIEQYEGAPNPSVGFIIDDIDFSGIGSVATLFDLQRIEVLRGPQGTRYGSNALAGLIYMQSTEPTDEWSTDLRLSAGDDDMFAGGIAFGGLLSDSMGFRLSAQHHRSDGFRRNPYLGRSDTNGREETTLRGKLLWEAGDAWLFRFTGMYVDLDDGYDAFALDNSLTVLSDNPGRDAQESLGASFRADYDAGELLEFTSITSFADSDIGFSFDADWGNEDSWAPFTYDYISFSDRERQTISQEFRLASARSSGTSWLVGVYALRLEEDLTTVNQGVYDDPVVYFFSDSLDATLASDFESTNIAVFGQLDIPVGDSGDLTLGLRLEERTTDYQDSDGLSAGPDDSLWGGEIAYRHEFSSRVAVYALLSRGFKAGGFNLGLVPPGRREFGDEVLWNVETGVKTNWADGRVRFDAAVFYNERDDQQVRISTQLNPNDPASFVFFTDNAASGRSLGLEADLTWFPAESLELFANVGLLDAEFDDFVSDGVDLSGRDQAHAPSYSMMVGGTYRHANGFFTRLDLRAVDEFYFDVSHDQKSQAYEIVNARLGYEAERWTAQLWARNLFDESYAVRGFFFGNEPPDFFNTLYIRQGDPRQVGITLDLSF